LSSEFLKDLSQEQACYTNFERRNNWALAATITVLTDMSTAPMAGDKMIPQRARTPAASRIATTLYHARNHLCTSRLQYEEEDWRTHRGWATGLRAESGIEIKDKKSRTDWRSGFSNASFISR
jgi:hypothetical protein